MTASEAAIVTMDYLDAFNLVGWRFKVVERFTSPQLADKVGYCEATHKTIWVTKRGLNLETIQHEVAHALQPIEQFRSAEKAHAADFQAALERVQKMELK
jgi:hypothetical protein